MKLSHERNVRSLAKKTFGSTRVGRAMRLLGVEERRGAEDMVDWGGEVGGGMTLVMREMRCREGGGWVAGLRGD